MDLNDLDLNLLRVFNQLMMDRSVSRVAKALGVSQPAVSNALRRLRVLLSDELFLRTAQGMQPTPLAEHIAAPIADAIETIRSAVSQQPGFDPAQAQRSFTIATTDLGELYVLPRLLAQIASEAPGVALKSVSSSAQTLKDDLESGRADMALGCLPYLQGGHFRQRLFHEPYALAYRKRHPLDRGRKTSTAMLADQQHLVVASQSLDPADVDGFLERHAVQRRGRANVCHVTAVGPILVATDLVVILPSGLLNALARSFEIVVEALPADSLDYSTEIFWHARLHRDPANQWLRRRIFDLFSASEKADR